MVTFIAYVLDIDGNSGYCYSHHALYRLVFTGGVLPEDPPTWILEDQRKKTRTKYLISHFIAEKRHLSGRYDQPVDLFTTLWICQVATTVTWSIARNCDSGYYFRVS